MMWSCPAWVEDALWRAAPRVSRAALVDAIIARSRAYTSDRDALASLRGPTDLAARAVFFTVADVAKLHIPLAELANRGLTPGGGGNDPLRVLDAGAGTGAMSLGLVAFLDGVGRRPVDVVAVDRDRDALAIARGALAARPDCHLTCVVGDERHIDRDRGPFDLVLLGSVLNELPPARQLPLVRSLVPMLAPGGAIIVIEPALRATARALHRIRDAIIDDGAHVFAPCVRAAAPCPMLASDRDWCHEDRPTQLPPRAAKLAAATGLRDGGLKFSYLTVRSTAGALLTTPAGRRALRVVSHPARLKGKLELFACGDAGRVRMRLLRRHRRDANRGFERARRGDVLIVGSHDDLGPADVVERRRPAEPER